MFHACTSQTWTKCGSSLVIQSANWAISKNLSSSCKSLARIQSALEIKPRKPPNATVVKARTGGAFSSGSMRVRPSCSRSAFKDSCTAATPPSSAAASSSKRIFLNLLLMPEVGGRRPEVGGRRQERGASKRQSVEPSVHASRSHAPRSHALRSSRSLGPLGRCQFAPAEGEYSHKPDNTAEKEHDLAKRQAQLSPGDAAASAHRINRRELLGAIHQPQHSTKGRDDDQVQRRVPLNAFLGVPTRHRAFLHRVGHGPARQGHRQISQGHKRRHREGKETGGRQAQRRQ